MSGTDVATTNAPPPVVGLEDSDEDGLVVPRLKIRKDGKFVDDRTKVEYSELDVVVLGAMKQRVLWHPTMQAGDHQPLCKAWDGKVGHPNDDQIDGFPWSAVPGELKPADLTDAKIDCSVCPLKQFGSHPKRDNTPWCTEQDIWVVVFPETGDAMLLTFSRSALTEVRKYKSYFKGVREPMFTVRTGIKLNVQSRGDVDYATPQFTRGEGTDEAEWPNWAEQFSQIKAFVQTPRSRTEEQPAPKADEPIDTKAQPAAAAAPQAGAPASSSTTDGDGFDEEPPF